MQRCANLPFVVFLKAYNTKLCRDTRKLAFYGFTSSDECAIHHGFCHFAAICTDTPWTGPSCRCPAPLYGNGLNCTCPTGYTGGPCAREYTWAENCTLFKQARGCSMCGWLLWFWQSAFVSAVFYWCVLPEQLATGSQSTLKLKVTFYDAACSVPSRALRRIDWSQLFSMLGYVVFTASTVC